MNFHDIESQLGCVWCPQEFTLPSAQLFKGKARFTNKRPFGLRLASVCKHLCVHFLVTSSNRRQAACVLHLTHGETEAQQDPPPPGWIPSSGSRFPVAHPTCLACPKPTNAGPRRMPGHQKDSHVNSSEGQF